MIVFLVDIFFAYCLPTYKGCAKQRLLYHEFVGKVMGSDGNEKSSFDNKVIKTEQMMMSSSIKNRWDPTEVDDCLKKKLPTLARGTWKALRS